MSYHALLKSDCAVASVASIKPGQIGAAAHAVDAIVDGHESKPGALAVLASLLRASGADLQRVRIDYHEGCDSVFLGDLLTRDA